MPKVIALFIVGGLAVGIVGGLLEGERWLYIGGFLLTIGMGLLYAYGIWKNPFGVIRVEANVTCLAEGMPPPAPIQEPAPPPPAVALVLEPPPDNVGRNLIGHDRRSDDGKN